MSTTTIIIISILLLLLLIAIILMLIFLLKGSDEEEEEPIIPEDPEEEEPITYKDVKINLSVPGEYQETAWGNIFVPCERGRKEEYLPNDDNPWVIWIQDSSGFTSYNIAFTNNVPNTLSFSSNLNFKMNIYLNSNIIDVSTIPQNTIFEKHFSFEEIEDISSIMLYPDITPNFINGVLEMQLSLIPDKDVYTINSFQE